MCQTICLVYNVHCTFKVGCNGPCMHTHIWHNLWRFRLVITTLAKGHWNKGNFHENIKIHSSIILYYNEAHLIFIHSDISWRMHFPNWSVNATIRGWSLLRVVAPHGQYLDDLDEPKNYTDIPFIFRISHRIQLRERCADKAQTRI